MHAGPDSALILHWCKYRIASVELFLIYTGVTETHIQSTDLIMKYPCSFYLFIPECVIKIGGPFLLLLDRWVN